MRKKIKFGWLPDLPDERDVLFHAKKPKVLNREHDLRWAGVIPPVRDQGEIGSCSGFGVTAVAWSAMMSDKTFRTPPFHPSELFVYYNGRRDKNNDEGASIREVVKGTVNFGLAPLETWIYNVKKVCVRPSERAYEQALKFKTIRYARVAHSEKEVVNTIASGYPIVFGHLCHSNFFDVGKNGMVPYPKGTLEGGHCEFAMAFNLNKKLIGVQNSWGVERGNGGYEEFTFDHFFNPDFVMDLWCVYEVSI